MTLQEVQWAVSVLVGVTVLVGGGFTIIRSMFKISQQFAKLVALHPRLDKYFEEQANMKLEIREIKTFLRVHPTLRFRIPDRGPTPATAAGPSQDMFTDGDQG
jgi:hypothetical protein